MQADRTPYGVCVFCCGKEHLHVFFTLHCFKLCFGVEFVVQLPMEAEPDLTLLRPWCCHVVYDAMYVFLVLPDQSVG